MADMSDLTHATDVEMQAADEAKQNNEIVHVELGGPNDPTRQPFKLPAGVTDVPLSECSVSGKLDKYFEAMGCSTVGDLLDKGITPAAVAAVLTDFCTVEEEAALSGTSEEKTEADEAKARKRFEEALLTKSAQQEPLEQSRGPVEIVSYFPLPAGVDDVPLSACHINGRLAERLLERGWKNVGDVLDAGLCAQSARDIIDFDHKLEIRQLEETISPDTAIYPLLLTGLVDRHAKRRQALAPAMMAVAQKRLDLKVATA